MSKDYLKMAEETYDYRSVDKRRQLKKNDPKTPAYQMLEELFEKYFKKDDVKIIKTETTIRNRKISNDPSFNHQLSQVSESFG